MMKILLRWSFHISGHCDDEEILLVHYCFFFLVFPLKTIYRGNDSDGSDWSLALKYGFILLSETITHFWKVYLSMALLCMIYYECTYQLPNSIHNALSLKVSQRNYFFTEEKLVCQNINVHKLEGYNITVPSPTPWSLHYRPWLPLEQDFDYLQIW